MKNIVVHEQNLEFLKAIPKIEIETQLFDFDTEMYIFGTLNEDVFCNNSIIVADEKEGLYFVHINTGR